MVAPNRLEQNFSVAAPDRVWATDITYIRTFEGWLYLAVVVDLYSRIVVGWSMKPALTRELVLDALLMAVWRRRPKQPVIVHSDQGSQYGSDDAVRFCKDHGLIPSMSRRGNCFDNAVAESFFSSLKKERIRRRIYPSREEARADVFDYIEVFYNRNPPAQSPRSSQSARLRTGSPNTGLTVVYKTGGSPRLSRLAIARKSTVKDLKLNVIVFESGTGAPG